MNKTFKITRISDNEQTYKYSAEIYSEHPIFRGHFPQAPVVPGVCTMNMIKECIADVLSCDVRYNYIKECKFLSAISPSIHKVVDVIVTLKQIDGQMNAVATVVSGEEIMMKLKATLI